MVQLQIGVTCKYHRRSRFILSPSSRITHIFSPLPMFKSPLLSSFYTSNLATWAIHMCVCFYRNDSSVRTCGLHCGVWQTAQKPCASPRFTIIYLCSTYVPMCHILCGICSVNCSAQHVSVKLKSFSGVMTSFFYCSYRHFCVLFL